MATAPKTIGIVGLGLIGGSVGLALRDPSRRILGFDPSPEAGKLAMSRFCVDQLATLEEVAQCEIVVVASPPATLVANLEALVPLVGPETVVTDCASVKGEAVRWATERKVAWFVPGHPMAGHEKTSAAYASAWMFRNARWLLTPTPHTAKSAIKKVEALVGAMGAVAVRCSADLHDRQVAVLSHLPHVFAAALVMLGQDLERTDISGGSWRDLTRVGGVDPDLWTQILMGNRQDVAATLSDASAILGEFARTLENGDSDALRALLERARLAKQKQETS